MKHPIAIIFAFTINLLSFTWLCGQNKDYYSKVEEIKTAEYTYRITREEFAPHIIRIENASNTKFHKPWYYKNSNKIVNYELYSIAAKLENEEMLYQLMREALTSEELDKIRYAVTDSKENNVNIGIQVVVSTSEGRIQEMIFYIEESQHYFLDIHPDKLYKIETLFKKNLRFHMIQPKSEEIMDYIKGTTVRIDLRKL
jgi:lipopolysaccharide export system protein LptC